MAGLIFLGYLVIGFLTAMWNLVRWWNTSYYVECEKIRDEKNKRRIYNLIPVEDIIKKKKQDWVFGSIVYGFAIMLFWGIYYPFLGIWYGISWVQGGKIDESKIRGQESGAD